MIERLLAAEGALARDELDHARHLYEQVAAADPRNAIAVVGLARVAAQRGDATAARAYLEHALEIDPDEAAARRLLLQLDAPAAEASAAAPEPAAPASATAVPAAQASATAEAAVQAAAQVVPQAPVGTPPQARRSFLDRLLGWLGLRSRS
jgi:tetratricopeptide (TPR) repeat protein